MGFAATIRDISIIMVALESFVIMAMLGILIWRQWPASALWVIGLFVGIDLLLQGVSLIMLGLAAKRLPASQTAPAF